MQREVCNIQIKAKFGAEIAADTVIDTLQRHGFQALRVGGCVRDRLLQRQVKDVDVVTDARPQAVKNMFPRTYAVGEAFGVIIVHTDAGFDVEVATFRTETGYADGRHPDAIVFAGPEEDAHRRDFTVNALFYDPCKQCLYDYVGGMRDLQAGILRAVGEPGARFNEDSLRLLRAVRFAAELDFALEPATAAGIIRQAATLNRVSAERIFSELNRMLLGRAPAAAFALLAELQLLEVCLPEVAAMRGVEQPPQFHPEGDVWTHTLLLLRNLRAPSQRLAWAALLHDVGKPLTHEFSDGRDRFPLHAKVGYETARNIMRRLKTSRNLTEEVAHIVGNHMYFMDVQKMRQAKLRRLLQGDLFDDELELHRLDCLSSHRKLDNYCFLLDKLQELNCEPPVPPPLITGRDILDLGVPSGPRIGEILNRIQDMQLENQLQSRDEALALLPQLVNE